MYHPNSRFHRAICCLLFTIVAWPGAALAGALVYEGFAYPPGMPLPGMPLGFGWSAPWVGSGQMIAAPPTLQYPVALPPTGIALLNTAVGEAFRPFGPALNNFASDLWISFMERTNVAGGGTFVSLDPVSGSFPTIFVNKDGGGTVTLSNGGPLILAGPSAGVGNVDFLLLRISKFNGVTSTVDLYLNPAAATLGPPSASFTVGSPFSIGQFYFRSDPQQVLDEIRVGTLPTDVAAAFVKGDLNCDGAVDFRDINPFVLYLSNPSAWQAAYPGCPAQNGDINNDGTYPSFRDINPFVALLSGR